MRTIKPLLSARDRDEFRTLHWEDPLGWSVKMWYQDRFPTDELGSQINEELNFNQLDILFKYGVPFYTLIGVGDSVVRERIFYGLSEVTGKPVKYYYDNWC